MNYAYLETKGAVKRGPLNPCLSADSPFMPLMDKQSADSPEHTALDGSINLADNPCNNYVARASHLASLGFSVAPSSKIFF